MQTCPGTGPRRTAPRPAGGATEKAGLVLLAAVAIVVLLGAVAATASAEISITGDTVTGAEYVWETVANTGDTVPGDTLDREFNSFNQPSVNVDGLVVFRGRSKGGRGSGQPAHGVYTRDMATWEPIAELFGRTTVVPQPNNLGSAFIEPPAFPRIDMYSDTVASRANHQPVWNYLLEDGTDTRAGTTGIYTDPFGSLIAGASNLGAAPDFSFFAVPGYPGVKFDVFPGAPAVADGSTIVFKGNFTVDGVGKTGVYYRTLTDAPITLLDGTALQPAGGTDTAVLIASTDTTIPRTQSTKFGSTAPPSAARGKAVFAGFDNEESPTKGGIYLARLEPSPTLEPLVSIGDSVPGEKKGNVFNRLGEGLSYDGRFVAFWGAWGTETNTLTLQCPEDGNQARLDYCRELYPDGYETTVPKYQGIFVYDTSTDSVRAIAKTPEDFADFVYWNFSGLVPGTGESDEDGEFARWRSASFVAVSGLVDGSLNDATFHVVFKARKGEIVDGEYTDVVDGIYLGKGPGNPPYSPTVWTGMDGSLIDPMAVNQDTSVGLPVTAMGIERDGFRGDTLALTVSMGDADYGWAGIYLTIVPDDLE